MAIETAIYIYIYIYCIYCRAARQRMNNKFLLVRHPAVSRSLMSSVVRAAVCWLRENLGLYIKYLNGLIVVIIFMTVKIVVTEPSVIHKFPRLKVVTSRLRGLPRETTTAMSCAVWDPLVVQGCLIRQGSTLVTRPQSSKINRSAQIRVGRMTWVGKHACCMAGYPWLKVT